MYLNPRIVGSGERTLVLSHGYGGSQAIWDKVLPHLSRTNKVRRQRVHLWQRWARSIHLLILAYYIGWWSDPCIDQHIIFIWLMMRWDTNTGTTLRLGLLEYRRRRRRRGGRGAQLLHVLEVRRRAGGAHGQDEAERRRVRGALHGRHGRLHCVHHAPRPLHPPRPRRRIPEVSEHAHRALHSGRGY